MLKSRGGVRRVGTSRAAPSTVALVLVTAIGPIAADAYLPALPDLQHDLGTSAFGAQLTLTTFLIGTAVGQLLCGPLSDAWGRRRFLLWGTSVFLVTSIGTVVAGNLCVLLACRTLQGISAGCGIAVGRAVVGDSCEGLEAARRFATLAMITMLGPVVAPVMGGLLLIEGTWRTVFATLVVMGVLMTLGTLLGLPESLPPERRQDPGLGRFAARQLDLLGDRTFAVHVAIQCLLLSAMFVYLGGGAFVMHHAYAVGDSYFAFVFAVNSACLATASTLFRLSIGRVDTPVMRTVGITAMSLGAMAMVTAGALEAAGHRPPLAVLWIGLMVTSAGAGTALPATMTMAMLASSRSLGAASGLLSGLPFICAAATTPLTGLLGQTTIMPMAASMGVLIAAAAIAHLTSRSSLD